VSGGTSQEVSASATPTISPRAATSPREGQASRAMSPVSPAAAPSMPLGAVTPPTMTPNPAGPVTAPASTTEQAIDASSSSKPKGRIKLVNKKALVPKAAIAEASDNTAAVSSSAPGTGSQQLTSIGNPVSSISIADAGSQAKASSSTHLPQSAPPASSSTAAPVTSLESTEINAQDVKPTSRPSPILAPQSETASQQDVTTASITLKPKGKRMLINKKVVKDGEDTKVGEALHPPAPPAEPERISRESLVNIQLEESKPSHSVSIPHGISLDTTANNSAAVQQHSQQYVPLHAPNHVMHSGASSSTAAAPPHMMPANPLQMNPGMNMIPNPASSMPMGAPQHRFRQTNPQDSAAAAQQHHQMPLQVAPAAPPAVAPAATTPSSLTPLGAKRGGKLINKAVAKVGNGQVVPVATPIVSPTLSHRPAPTPMQSPVLSHISKELFLAFRITTLNMDKPRDILRAKEYKNCLTSSSNLTDMGWRDESRGNKDKNKKVKKEEKSNKLTSGANSWATSVQKNKQLGDDDQLIIRKCKGILNKLTVEKFDKLFDQLIQVGMSKACHIEALMKEVFEKATTQHHFIEMYTNLCKRLDNWCKESNIDADFRRILLAQCQASFENNLIPPAGMLNADVNDEVAFEAEVKYKTAMLGNIKFVGRLLVTQLIASRILVQAASQLLEHRSDVTLECLCALIMATGKEFDDSKWKFHHSLKGILNEAKSMINNKDVASRIRFLLQDVFDSQARGWMTKEEYAQANPQVVRP